MTVYVVVRDGGFLRAYRNEAEATEYKAQQERDEPAMAQKWGYTPGKFSVRKLTRRNAAKLL